ncbi:MAG: ATP-binding cassette domain-containing protein [Pseudomonadota bacterium]
MDGQLDWASTATVGPAITLSGTLTLGGRALARDVAIEAEAGRWTAILGRSGVGKTTLLKAIAGLLAPNEFDGRVAAADGAPLAGRIAWMAQKDHLVPWLNAVENAALGARLRREPVDWTRARAALDAVGLTPRADADVSELSGGERQRVALARTLLEDRPVALLDEPFSALDAVTRAELQELAAARLRGKTVLLVTHDPFEAARLADRLYILRASGTEPVPAPPSPGPRDPAEPGAQKAAAALLATLRGAP